MISSQRNLSRRSDILRTPFRHRGLVAMGIIFALFLIAGCTPTSSSQPRTYPSLTIDDSLLLPAPEVLPPITTDEQIEIVSQEMWARIRSPRLKPTAAITSLSGQQHAATKRVADDRVAGLETTLRLSGVSIYNGASHPTLIAAASGPETAMWAQAGTVMSLQDGVQTGGTVSLKGLVSILTAAFTEEDGDRTASAFVWSWVNSIATAHGSSSEKFLARMLARSNDSVTPLASAIGTRTDYDLTGVQFGLLVFALRAQTMGIISYLLSQTPVATTVGQRAGQAPSAMVISSVTSGVPLDGPDGVHCAADSVPDAIWTMMASFYGGPSDDVVGAMEKVWTRASSVLKWGGKALGAIALLSDALQLYALASTFTTTFVIPSDEWARTKKTAKDAGKMSITAAFSAGKTVPASGWLECVLRMAVVAGLDVSGNNAGPTNEARTFTSVVSGPAEIVSQPERTDASGKASIDLAVLRQRSEKNTSQSFVQDVVIKSVYHPSAAHGRSWAAKMANAMIGDLASGWAVISQKNAIKLGKSAVGLGIDGWPSIADVAVQAAGQALDLAGFFNKTAHISHTDWLQTLFLNYSATVTYRYNYTDPDTEMEHQAAIRIPLQATVVLETTPGKTATGTKSPLIPSDPTGAKPTGRIVEKVHIPAETDLCIEDTCTTISDLVRVAPGTMSATAAGVYTTHHILTDWAVDVKLGCVIETWHLSLRGYKYVELPSRSMESGDSEAMDGIAHLHPNINCTSGARLSSSLSNHITGWKINHNPTATKGRAAVYATKHLHWSDASQGSVIVDEYWQLTARY